MALGWSFAESLLSRFVDFYVNARSMQFDWKHILVALDANMSLVQNVCICTLLYLTSRSGSKKVPSVLILAYLLMLSVIGNNLLYKGILVGSLSLSTLLVAV